MFFFFFFVRRYFKSRRKSSWHLHYCSRRVFHNIFYPRCIIIRTRLSSLASKYYRERAQSLRTEARVANDSETFQSSSKTSPSAHNNKCQNHYFQTNHRIYIIIANIIVYALPSITIKQKSLLRGFKFFFFVYLLPSLLQTTTDYYYRY